MEFIVLVDFNKYYYTYSPPSPPPAAMFDSLIRIKLPLDVWGFHRWRLIQYQLQAPAVVAAPPAAPVPLPDPCLQAPLLLMVLIEQFSA